MPVLKRALQAPPIVDTNVLMNEAYRVHKKFRYSISDKHSSSSSSSSSSHSSAASTSSISSSPPPPPSPSSTHTPPFIPLPSVSPYRPVSSNCSPPQLYPQLASALTTPRSSSDLYSQSQFKSPLQLQHSTLAMKLNEKPKHMTEDQQVTSELFHSIIMRGGGGADPGEIVSQRNTGSSQSGNNSGDNSQVPLNLSKKIVC